MHNSVRMTIFCPTHFMKRGIIFMFHCYIASTTDEVDQLWCISSHGELLDIWRSNFVIFGSTQRSLTPEQSGEITAFYLVSLDIDISGVVDKYIYLLLFYKPIWGSSGAMQSCMFFIHGPCVAWTVYIICLLLVRAALLGVGQKVGCSSRLFSNKTGTFGFFPLFIYFTRCFSTPWIFSFTGFSAVSYLDNRLRDPLRSEGLFIFPCLWHFLKGV